MCGSIKRGGRRKGKKRTHLSLENCIAFIPEEGYSAIQNLEKVEISKEEVVKKQHIRLSKIILSRNSMLFP